MSLTDEEREMAIAVCQREIAAFVATLTPASVDPTAVPAPAPGPSAEDLAEEKALGVLALEIGIAPTAIPDFVSRLRLPRPSRADPTMTVMPVAEHIEVLRREASHLFSKPQKGNGKAHEAGPWWK